MKFFTYMLAIVCTLTVSTPALGYRLEIDNSQNKSFKMWVEFNANLVGKSCDWRRFFEPGEVVSTENCGLICYKRVYATVQIPTRVENGKPVAWRSGGTFSWGTAWPCGEQIIRFISDPVTQTLCMRCYYPSSGEMRGRYQEKCITFAQAAVGNASYQF